MRDTVFTIGHSRHPIERFLELLQQHGIAVVCDVRSTPLSRLNPQFNRETLQRVLRVSGIEYVFLGKELGARSEDRDCYVGGKLQYDRLGQTDLFRRGLDHVQEQMKDHRLALMCAEKEPLECHRTILVARHLEDLGIHVEHIHADGHLESHDAALSRLATMFHLPEYDLFHTREDFMADAYRRQGERIAYEAESAKGATG